MTAVLAEPILGSITPRLFTPPLVEGVPGPCGCGCALTESTSYGFRAVRFATERLGRAPWAWQRWLMIHAGELSPLGIPRFRRLIVTVGRQSGKTRSVEDLTLFWILDEKHPSVLGTSTLTKYAKKPWRSAYNLVKKSPDLAALLPGERPFGLRTAAGEEEWWTVDDCHYAVAASNAEGGRSMSNQRVIADEFAKQHNYDAYGAAYYSMDAFEDAQYFALTTPDPKGEPYRELRAAALALIEGEPGDESLGLFEWSCPDDADPTDLRALAMANPTMNRPGGKNGERLVREARAAVAKGGRLLETFKQEIMCIQVSDQDAVIDLAAYARCLDPGDLEAVRDRVAMVFDVAPSMRHCTLYAGAVLPDGRVRVDPVEAWDGPGCVDRAARELPALVARAKPKAFGWLPSGPAAAVGAQLADRGQKGRAAWPPRGVEVREIRGELTQVAMGFSALVAAEQLAHSGDPLLDDNVESAEKYPVGDAWRFSRKGEGDVDALYAAAGAAFLAQTLPAPVGKPRILMPRGV
jgi:hypothetical protein